MIRQNNPWMDKSHPLMTLSSVEKTMDDFFIIGFHPWMKTKDDAHGHGKNYVNLKNFFGLTVFKRLCIKQNLLKLHHSVIATEYRTFTKCFVHGRSNYREK